MITPSGQGEASTGADEEGIQKYPAQTDIISARGIPTNDKGNAKIAASLRPNLNIITFCTITIAVEMIVIMNIETHNAEGEMGARNSLRDVLAVARAFRAILLHFRVQA